jgi:hypothetical protein
MYERGDYVKAEVQDEATSESELMWVRVEWTDESKRLVVGTLESEPALMTDPRMRRGVQIGVSYDQIREHVKEASFRQ